MITLKSVIVAFLFAISLWFLFSYHKGTCSTQSNPSVVCLTTGTCSSASGGTFENATDGTFHSATAGTFVSAMPGTFVSATGGTFNPLLSNNVPSSTLRSLAEEMKEGLERASSEASDFISSVKPEGDITRRFEICSNLASEICPHIDIVKLSLEYYQSSDKWAVEIIGGNSKIGYQGGSSVFCFYKNVVREFLASDEFIVVCMHQLCECDDQLADCEREVRRW